MAEFELKHETVISELSALGLNPAEMPPEIRMEVGAIKGYIAKEENKNNGVFPPEKTDIVMRRSGKLADRIITWYESDIKEENQNPTDMTPDQQTKFNAAKAKAIEAQGKKDWPAAKAGFEEALSISAEDQESKDGLTAVNAAIETEATEIAAAEKTKALIARAKAVGIAEDSTEEQIVAAETAKDKTPAEPTAAALALAARAKAAGLSETATEAEIIAAETAKAKTAGDKKPDQPNNSFEVVDTILGY